MTFNKVFIFKQCTCNIRGHCQTSLTRARRATVLLGERRCRKNDHQGTPVFYVLSRKYMYRFFLPYPITYDKLINLPINKSIGTKLYYILQYVLETYTEERSTKWDHDPYRGMIYFTLRSA